MVPSIELCWGWEALAGGAVLQPRSLQKHILQAAGGSCHPQTMVPRYSPLQPTSARINPATYWAVSAATWSPTPRKAAISSMDSSAQLQSGRHAGRVG